jgi:hypothetical protein
METVDIVYEQARHTRPMRSFQGGTPREEGYDVVVYQYR